MQLIKKLHHPNYGKITIIRQHGDVKLQDDVNIAQDTSTEVITHMNMR